MKRVVEIEKNAEGKIVTSFVYAENIFTHKVIMHQVTSYVWTPSDEQIMDWLDNAKHPVFTYV